LDAIDLEVDVTRANVETQYTLPSGKRPDIAIFAPGSTTLVESKLGSGFGETQIPDYIEFLATSPGRKTLVLLTQTPELVPNEYQEQAKASGVRVVSLRWHDMSRHIGEPGEDSLAGDFVQLLIREGLVKPEPLTAADWKTWNGGYNVLLRLESLLNELGPEVGRMRMNAKWRSTNGLSKRWIYRVWRTEGVELGFGLGAAPGDKLPHADPIAFAFVGNKAASEDDAMRAVGVDRSTRYRWSFNELVQATSGLLYSWPCLSRPSEAVLKGESFEAQVHEAAAFLHETAEYFRGRGYLPTAFELSPPRAS
jgi:hypothetical protein